MRNTPTLISFFWLRHWLGVWLFLFSPPICEAASRNFSNTFFLPLAETAQEQDLKKAAHADSLRRLAYADKDIGAYEQALSKLEKAIPLYQSISYFRQLVECMSLQGKIYYKTDRLDFAMAKYERAIRILQDNNVEDPELEADCRYNYGYVLYLADRYNQAIEAFDAAKNLYEKIRSPKMAAACLKLKAHCYYDQEKYDFAAVVFGQAEERYQTISDDSTRGVCTYYLGLSYFGREQYQRSIQPFSEAMDLLDPRRPRSNPAIYADCLKFIASAHFKQEQYMPALQAYRQVRPLFRALEAWPDEAFCLMRIGNCYFVQPDYARAAAYFDSARVVYRRAESKDAKENEAVCAVNAGNALFNLGQYEEAVSRYLVAAPIDSVLGLQEHEAKVRQYLGDALANLGQYEKAHAEYMRAAALYAKLDNRLDLAKCYEGIADGYFSRELYNEALDYYARALNYFPFDNASASSRAWCFYRQARTLHLLEQCGQALLSYEQAEALYRSLENSSRTGESLYYAGDCHLALKQYGQARQKYDAALAALQTTGEAEKIGLAYRKLGNYYSDLNHSDEAIQNYESALSFYRQTDDLSGTAHCIFNLAKLLIEKNEFEKAKANYLEAQRLYQQAGDSAGVAGCNFGLGRQTFQQERYQEAQGYYETARQIYHALNDHSNEALCLLNLGSASFNLKDFRRALTLYLQSDSLFRRLDDNENTADCQIRITKTYLRFNPPELEKALSSANAALNRYRSISDPAGIANALVQIGGINLLRLEFASAKANFEEALAKYGSLPESLEKADCEVRLAKAEAGLGNYGEALKWLDKAQEIILKYDDKEALANYWFARGTVLYSTLRYEEALQNYANALTGYQKAKLDDAEADCRIQIANVYYDINQPDSAAYHYRNALSLTEKSGNEETQATSLMLLGNIYYDKKQYQEAKSYYDRALKMGMDQADYVLEISCRINLGNIKIQAQQIEPAAADYQQALDLARQHNFPIGEVIGYGNLASVYEKQAKYPQALDYLSRAETICQRYYFKRELRLVYTNKGVVLEKLERLNEATDAYIAAIKIIDQIGTGLRREHLLRSFFQDYAELYNHLILLLYQQNRLGEVMLYAEKMKSPESLQIFQEVIERSGNPALIAYFNEQAKNIMEARRRLERTAKLEMSDNTELWHETAKTIEGSFARIVQEAAKYGVNLEDIYRVGHFKNERIADDQAYVLYYPTAEALLIVVMTREGHRGIAVKIAQKELYAHIEAYRNEINRAIGNIRQTQRLPEIIDWNDPSLTPLLREAQALYDNLIAPIEPQIARKKAVTIVPSGTIYYLPVHALAKKRGDGDYEFVLERWRVSYLLAFRFGFAQPSFKPLPKENIFVFANSLGDLTEAEKAADEILNFVSSAQVFVRDQASEEQYKKLRQQYAILVLLNHCRLDPSNPQQTYIQLAGSSKDDGRLYFNEVQSYRCPSLELAILTACETAIGGNHNGAEILNMASAYSLAGARSIIATLWAIPEYSTKELMVHFYREFFEKQQSPLEALHQAQLSLMKDPRFKHPLFWGAFTFTGDLR